MWKAFLHTLREHRFAAPPSSFFFFFWEGDYWRIPITEHLPQIPAHSRLCRRIETAELSAGSTHTVWNRFLRLGKTVSQPAKILPGQGAVTQRLSETLLTEPQFCRSGANPSRCWLSTHTGRSPASVGTQLHSHNVHCYSTQSLFPLADALFWVLCKWFNKNVTRMYIPQNTHRSQN